MFDRKNIISLQSPHFRKSRHIFFFPKKIWKLSVTLEFRSLLLIVVFWMVRAPELPVRTEKPIMPDARTLIDLIPAHEECVKCVVY